MEDGNALTDVIDGKTESRYETCFCRSRYLCVADYRIQLGSHKLLNSDCQIRSITSAKGSRLKDEPTLLGLDLGERGKGGALHVAPDGFMTYIEVPCRSRFTKSSNQRQLSQ